MSKYIGMIDYTMEPLPNNQTTYNNKYEGKVIFKNNILLRLRVVGRTEGVIVLKLKKLLQEAGYTGVLRRKE